MLSKKQLIVPIFFLITLFSYSLSLFATANSEIPLIIIDMQNVWLNNIMYPQESNEFIERIVKKAADARAQNREIILVEYKTPRIQDPTISQITKILEGYSKVYVICKDSADGSIVIEGCLDVLGNTSNELEVCGIDTAACVVQTVKGLNRAGKIIRISPQNCIHASCSVYSPPHTEVFYQHLGALNIRVSIERESNYYPPGAHHYLRDTDAALRLEVINSIVMRLKKELEEILPSSRIYPWVNLAEKIQYDSGISAVLVLQADFTLKFLRPENSFHSNIQPEECTYFQKRINTQNAIFWSDLEEWFKENCTQKN